MILSLFKIQSFIYTLGLLVLVSLNGKIKTMADIKNSNEGLVHESSANSEIANRKKYEELYFVDTSKPVWNYSLINDDDIRNYQQGTHYTLYQCLGNHSLEVLDTK